VGDDRAVTFDAGFQLHNHRMPRRAGKKLFAILHHHLDWPATADSEQVTNRLIDRRALAAEVAANRHRVDADLFLGDAESLRHAFFQAMRHLIGRPHLHAFALVDPHQTTMRLEE
jgi:hypothetical protein